MTEIVIRHATPADAKAVAPLMLSSGPKAFGYIFHGDACPHFLARAFVTPAAQFSYTHHWVAELDGRVVGVAGAFTTQSLAHTLLPTGWQILRCFGLFGGIQSIVRGIRFESALVKPPLADCFYIAHVGVSPECRSQGIGAKLMAHLRLEGIQRGFHKLSLDVAVTNPRAQALYEQLGYAVVEERESYSEELDGIRYMECSV